MLGRHSTSGSVWCLGKIYKARVYTLPVSLLRLRIRCEKDGVLKSKSCFSQQIIVKSFGGV